MGATDTASPPLSTRIPQEGGGCPLTLLFLARYTDTSTTSCFFTRGIGDYLFNIFFIFLAKKTGGVHGGGRLWPRVHGESDTRGSQSQD